MPQMAVPLIFGDQRFPGHLQQRASMFERRAREATEILSDIPGVLVNCPGGAFYLTVMFEEGVLNKSQTLKVENNAVREMVEEMVADIAGDQRFVYYLLGATGICVVPLSGFYCRRDGFRATLLETDDAKRRATFEKLAEAIREYLRTR